MSRKAMVRSHATYLPRPPAPRRILAPRPHATPAEQPPPRAAVPRRPVRSVVPPRGRRKAATRHGAALLEALCPGAILVCALGSTFVGLLLGLSTAVRYALQQRLDGAIFPLLLGGTILILLRGQISAESYWGLRRRLGLVTGHWSDHAFTLLYSIALFLGVAIISTLLAWAGAMLIGTVID